MDSIDLSIDATAPSVSLPIDIDIGEVMTNVQSDKPLRPLLTPIPGTSNDFQFSIDNSSLERFTTCARAAEYYIVNRRELSVYSAPLAFGKAIHSALETKYLHQGGSREAVRQRQLEQVVHEFQDNPIPVGDHRTLDRAMDVVERYDKAFPVEPFSVITHPVTGEKCVEMRFEKELGKIEINDWVPIWPSLDLNLPGLKLGYIHSSGNMVTNFPSNTLVATHVYIASVYALWTGRIDMIVEMDGLNWIMDHKTTQMMGPQFFAEFQLSNATVGYAWAAQQILGQPIAGLILNALCVRKPSRTGTSTEFGRERFFYTQDQLEEWHNNTLVLVSDFLHHLRRAYFPMETKWCFAKYGKCPYHDVCSMPAKDRKEILASSQFKSVTWNPLAD